MFTNGQILSEVCKILPDCPTTTPEYTTNSVPLREVTYSCHFSEIPDVAVEIDINLTVALGGCGNEQHSGSMGVMVGGKYNDAANDFSVLFGGFRTQSLSNYAVGIGGYSNRALGRFSLVAGGSQNDLSKHHSTAFGHFATSTFERTLTLAFTGDECSNDGAKRVNICAESIVVNAEPIATQVKQFLSTMQSRIRRLRVVGSSGEKIEELQTLVLRQRKLIKALSDIDQGNRILRKKIDVFNNMISK
jgi:hypothetical protein